MEYLDENGKPVSVEKLIGVGYTLATGRLYTDFHLFHQYAEELLGRSIWTHEFASEDTWEKLKAEFEQSMKKLLEV